MNLKLRQPRYLFF